MDDCRRGQKQVDVFLVVQSEPHEKRKSLSPPAVNSYDEVSDH